MAVTNIASVLNVIQKLFILLALLHQNLIEVFERPLRKDLSSKKCSDLVAAPSTFNVSGTMSSLQALADTQSQMLLSVALLYKSTTEEGSKWNLVKATAESMLICSIHPDTTNSCEAFPLFTSHSFRTSTSQIIVVPGEARSSSSNTKFVNAERIGSTSLLGQKVKYWANVAMFYFC